MKAMDLEEYGRAVRACEDARLSMETFLRICKAVQTRKQQKIVSDSDNYWLDAMEALFSVTPAKEEGDD